MRALAATLLTMAACTFEDGRPFGALEPAPVVTGAFDAPADRKSTAEGQADWLRLASDYELRITRAELELPQIELLGAAAQATRFDPAHPPDGFSACHGGHCHADDGRLVPYDEVAGSGSGAPRPVVATLPLGRLALVPGGSRAAACPSPCDLPRGEITGTRAPLARIVFEGQVRDARAVARLPGPLSFRVDAPLAAAALSGTAALAVDEDHEPAIALALAVRPGPAAFDGIEWAALAATDGVVDLAAPANAAALASLRTGLLETPIVASATRSDL